jgi:integrase
MPKLKTTRKEKVVYTPEWIETVDKAREYAGNWLAAWLSFDWAFGKRRNEISKLIRKNVWVQEGFLYVRFYVGKKRSRTASVDQLPYTKKKTLDHKAIPYILAYLKEYDEKGKPSDGYLFPWAKPRKTSVTVHTKFKNKEGKEETKEYTYKREIGYVNPDLVAYYIKKVNPNFWPHLGRHSVATRAAEDGATEYDISNILDVSVRTASVYVHHGTKLIEAWSKKTE